MDASWTLRRPPWDNQTTTMITHKKKQFPDPSTQFPPRLWASILEVKIDQNRMQNESKIKTIFKSETNALQEPLGAVLDRSWDILEAILGSIFHLKPFVLKGLVKIHVFDVDKLPRRILDRTWPILAAKRAENDPKLASQNDPKSNKN